MRLPARLRSLHLETAALAVPLILFVSGISLARGLGPASRGQLAVFMVGGATAAFVATLSLDKGIIHELRFARVDARPDVWASSLVGVRATSAGALIIGAIWAWVVGLTLFLGVAMAATAALWVWMEANSGWAIGTGQLWVLSRWRVATPACWAVSVLGVMVIIPASHDIARLNCLAVAFLATMLGPTLWLRRRATIPAVKPKFIDGYWNSIWNYGIRYHPTSLATYLTSRVDLLVLPLLTTDYAVGIYAVAVTPSALVGASRSALVVRGLAGSQVPGRKFWAALVCGAALGALSLPWVIPALYGVDYSGAVVPAQILVIGAIFDLPTGLLGARWAGDRQLGRAFTLQGAVLAASAIGLVVLWLRGDTSLVLVALVVTLARVAIGFVSMILLARGKMDALVSR